MTEGLPSHYDRYKTRSPANTCGLQKLTIFCSSTVFADRSIYIVHHCFNSLSPPCYICFLRNVTQSNSKFQTSLATPCPEKLHFKKTFSTSDLFSDNFKLKTFFNDLIDLDVTIATSLATSICYYRMD